MAFYGVGIDSEVVRVIGDIKLQLSNRYGSYGIRQLDLALKRANASLAHGAGLHPTEFIQTLKDLGVFVKQIQEQALKKYFICKQGTGTIDHASFVNSFRENLTPQREKIVREVFQRIDVNNNGAIEPEELNFVLGRKPEAQAVAEFMALFDTNQDGKVSLAEWHAYYVDVSALTHSDKAFEELVQSCWGPVQKEVELLKEQALHYVNLIRERLVTLTKGAEDEFKLQKLFQGFDKHNSGLLSLFEFDGMLLKLNIVVPRETLPLLFKSLDKNSSGYIEFDEFCNFLLYNPYKR